MRASDIRKARTAQGYTQERLAAAAGVNVRTVMRLEAGDPVRAETGIAVCAVLGLAYSPMSGIEVLGPTHLRDDDSTALLLDAAAGLPDVRYLVRPDAVGWSVHMRRAFSESTWRGLGQVGVLPDLLMLGLLLLVLSPLLPLVAALALDGRPALAVLAGLGFCLLPAMTTALVVFEVRQALRPIFHPERPEAVGFAVGESFVARLDIEGGQVRATRTDLDGAVEREGERNGDYMDYRIKTRDGLDTLRGLPWHPGLHEALAGPKPRDRVALLPPANPVQA